VRVLGQNHTDLGVVDGHVIIDVVLNRPLSTITIKLVMRNGVRSGTEDVAGRANDGKCTARPEVGMQLTTKRMLSEKWLPSRDRTS
jgi:hypothetical protein